MTCRRCGRNNPPNARHCTYCGTPLVMSNKKNNQKQTESVIVALIMVLVLLLVIVAGVVIYKNNNSRNVGFGGNGGGAAVPPPTDSTNNAAPYQIPNDSNAVEKSWEKEIPTEQPKQTEQPSTSNEKLAKKDAFLDKADDIEWYSENYLETAETQSEINSESGIVYKKWDALLNEVYQYLKTIMSDSEFEQLQEDEIAWITKKEKAIEAAGAEWEGGSGEPMARNLTAIQYTEERCYYLISLIN